MTKHPKYSPDVVEPRLSHRPQRVLLVLHGCKSLWLPVTSSVPQGSLLRPILFVTYINEVASYPNSHPAQRCSEQLKQSKKGHACKWYQADPKLVFMQQIKFMRISAMYWTLGVKNSTPHIKWAKVWWLVTSAKSTRDVGNRHTTEPRHQGTCVESL